MKSAVAIALAVMVLSSAAWADQASDVDRAREVCHNSRGIGARYLPGFENCSRIEEIWRVQHADELANDQAAREAARAQAAAAAITQKALINGLAQ